MRRILRALYDNSTLAHRAGRAGRAVRRPFAAWHAGEFAGPAIAAGRIGRRAIALQEFYFAMHWLFIRKFPAIIYCHCWIGHVCVYSDCAAGQATRLVQAGAAWSITGTAATGPRSLAPPGRASRQAFSIDYWPHYCPGFVYGGRPPGLRALNNAFIAHHTGAA